MRRIQTLISGILCACAGLSSPLRKPVPREGHLAAEAQQQRRTVLAAHSLSSYTVPRAGLEGIILCLALVSPACPQSPPGLICLKLGICQYLFAESMECSDRMALLRRTEFPEGFIESVLKFSSCLEERCVELRRMLFLHKRVPKMTEHVFVKLCRLPWNNDDLHYFTEVFRCQKAQVSNSPDKPSNSASNSNKLQTINSLTWLSQMQIIIPVYSAPPEILQCLWYKLIFEISFPGATGFFPI